VPPEHVGAVLSLCSEKRGVQKKNAVPRKPRCRCNTNCPWPKWCSISSIASNRLSRGYASFDYEFSHFQAAPLVKLDVLPINGDPVDCVVAHRPPRQFLYARPGAGRQDAGAHSTADVRHRRAGGDRRPHHLARQRQSDAQERASPSVTAATSRASASCSRNRKPARNA